MSFWKEAWQPLIAFAIGATLMLTFNLTNSRILKQENKALQEIIKENEKEKQVKLEIIQKLMEADTIQLPNIDSVLISIDEKDRTHIDSMSADELRDFLLGTD